MAVKLDSAFIKLCVCVKNSNFLSWAIRTVFVDPVTYHCHLYIASLLVICACAGKYGSVVMCAGNTILGEAHITVTQVTFLSDHSESPDR